MNPTSTRSIAAVALLALASSAEAQPTLELIPQPPVDHLPFTAEMTYQGLCFEEALVEENALGFLVTAIECCPSVPLEPPFTAPTTQRFTLTGLSRPTGEATLDLSVLTPLLSPAGCFTTSDSLELVASWAFHVAARGEIVAVDLVADGDGYAVRLTSACTDAVFRALPPANGVIRVRPVPSVPSGPPIPCTLQQQLETEHLPVGPLEAGAYAVAVEEINNPQRLLLVDTFVVPQTDQPAVELRDGRFVASVLWQTNDAQGAGLGRSLSADAAAFWFFRPSNVEILVKVLDGCQSSDHFWVFAAGLTNQGVTLTVTDTTTGASRTYESALGSEFAPILDTLAFSCAGAEP